MMDNLYTNLLENVAIAYEFQLEVARRNASHFPFRFKYDTIPSLKTLNLCFAVL